MKTLREVVEASNDIALQLRAANSDAQYAIITGMITALCWVAEIEASDGSKNSLQRLLDNGPLV